MPLGPGVRLGPYEIGGPLGKGGMGEVYRAHDLRLKRDVAVKSLPSEFADDPERLARFQREARALASLNHANIGSIYGLEESSGETYLVLEYIEGESLAELLARGPIPVDEALRIGAGIAAGLEAAHEAGIIHRDLKPGNVMIRPDGAVKVLDFGLAKTPDREATGSDQSRSPTITIGTQAGVILGTAAYMSPEQARGRTLDKRSDIFSFGCVLFECLTGRRAFAGETASDTLAAILAEEPDWPALPAATPARVRDLLRRCLQKDPRRRLHDIADARLEIEEALSPSSPSAVAAVPPPLRPPTPRRLPLLAAGLAAGLVIGAASMLLLSRRDRSVGPALPRIRAALSLPEGVNVLYGLKPSVAMSPNGTTVVFRGTRDGISRLYRQTLDGGEAVPIPGTEGGSGPFFSPDGQWIGFFARTALKKIPTTGGTPVHLCFASPVARGATWTADGTILFSRTPNQGLFRVSDQGGAVEVYSKLDAGRGEHAHQWPQALPRGRGTLVTIVRGQDFQDLASAQIVALEPGTLTRHVIIEGSSFARYVDAGRLVFIRGRKLYSIPFDLDRLVTTGEPTPVPGDPMVDDIEGIAHFASAGGALVTVAGAAPEQKLTEVLLADRKGAEQRLPLPAGSYMHPTLSPDGKRVVLAKWEQTRGKLFVYDRDRQVLAPLTPEPGRYFAPVWSPDGDRIAFSQYNSSQPRIAWKSADGSGEIQTPASQDTDAEFPSSWSADGKFIAYVLSHPAGQTGPDNIGILELAPSPVKRLWLAGPGDKSAPVFSPDGRWIAYVSNETGQNEVYLRPFTGTAGKIKISRDGGSEPLWRGRELVYRSGDDFLSVPLSASNPPLPGAPVLLFSGRFNHGGREDWPREYDMSAGGNAFLLTRSPETPDTRRPLLIMTRWADSPGNSP